MNRKSGHSQTEAVPLQGDFNGNYPKENRGIRAASQPDPGQVPGLTHQKFYLTITVYSRQF